MRETFTIRLDGPTRASLESRSARAGEPPRALARRYIEEGLRRDEHPLVHFVDGPAGRRPALLGSGLDVWEVIATVRDSGGDASKAAEYLDLAPHLVGAAVSYYGAYRAEIDAWIEANDREAEVAHSAWIAGRDAIGA